MPDSLYELLRDELQAEHPVAVAAVVRAPPSSSGPQLGTRLLIRGGGTQHGTLHRPDLETVVGQDALDLLSRERSELRTYTLGGAEQGPTPVAEGGERAEGEDTPAHIAATATDGEVHVFIDTHPAPSTLVIFGAVHTAMPLAKFARAAGFRVQVVDARAQLCTEERFPDAEQLLVAWPDEVAGDLNLNASTYVAILTHDDKFDEPALDAALSSPARYIGAIGSRRTHRKRIARLLAAGVPDEQIARIRGPSGRRNGIERLGRDDRGPARRQWLADERGGRQGTQVDAARAHLPLPTRCHAYDSSVLGKRTGG